MPRISKTTYGHRYLKNRLSNDISIEKLIFHGAEGVARQGSKEFIQFLYIASGSASELDTQIEIPKRTELGNVEALEKLQERITKIQMMLHGLIRTLKQKIKA